jgi:hypothetical protein
MCEYCQAQIYALKKRETLVKGFPAGDHDVPVLQD